MMENINHQDPNDANDSSLFLAVFDNPEKAKNALNEFKKVLSKRGSAQAADPTQQGFETLKGKDTYQGKLIIVHKDRYIAGAAGFESDKDAESLLAELIGQIP